MLMNSWLVQTEEQQERWLIHEENDRNERTPEGVVALKIRANGGAERGARAPDPAAPDGGAEGPAHRFEAHRLPREDRPGARGAAYLSIFSHQHATKSLKIIRRVDQNNSSK